ncbi:MAG TPA: methyltransferase [Candidatus Paceibacterota bacterium]|nr:methyltransferase [Candidatus Paceibacterota bacterium]HRZ34399.1 methyltransferase [Candidatus Paceibacterota bacterium]
MSQEKMKQPEKIDPENTRRFVRDILEKGEKGIYRVEVKVGDKVIPIDVYPEVFPPKSDYSASSRSLFEAFGDLKDLDVIDIGSGSGIESIVASLAGAKHVDATDISSNAVECTKHNVELNGLSEKITILGGDLFSAFPDKRYDLIIANLPIVDFKPEVDSIIVEALYDPNLDLHKRLFEEAKRHLNKNGAVTFTHSNLQSRDTENPNRDFEILEEIIASYGYKIIEKKESEAMGFRWINYKISLK